jgi:hypothetical protein
MLRCLEQVWLCHHRPGGDLRYWVAASRAPGWFDCQRPPWITLRREAVVRGMTPSIGRATRYLASQQWTRWHSVDCPTKMQRC